MIKDHLATWNGQFPYDALAPVGITPESSHAEVQDASFTLMTRRMMSTTTQKALDELRDPQRRLLVDILLYNIDLAKEIAAARERIERERAQLGEPPELVEALAVPDALLRELSDGLAPVDLGDPLPVSPPSLGRYPPPSLIDSMIQFDR